MSMDDAIAYEIAGNGMCHPTMQNRNANLADYWLLIPEVAEKP
jgi:hypothetical protein